MDIGLIKHGIPKWKCVVGIEAAAAALPYKRHSVTDLAAAQRLGASGPRARAVVGLVRLGVEIAGVETPDMRQERL